MYLQTTKALVTPVGRR